MNQKQIYSKLTEIQSQLINQTEQPITLEQAARHLDISKSYLYKLTSQNKIAHFKPNGKKIYFLKSDLNKWLMRGRVQSAEELDQKASNYVHLGESL